MAKLIVLDVDGTLYPLGSVAGRNFSFGASILADHLSITEAEAKKKMTDFGIKPYVCSDNKSITAFVISNGVSAEIWNQYRNQRFDLSGIDRADCASPDVLREMAKQYVTVLLSSNTITNVRKVLKHIQIDEKEFADIICIDTVSKTEIPFSKKDQMRRLCEKYSISPAEMVSVGDRYQTDIEPVLKLGGLGVLVQRPRSIDQLFTDLTLGRKLTDNNAYLVYR